jgi:RHH-type rel operon transcriptional repressor/antitoxin RelB
MLTLDLPKDIEDRLDSLARASGRSKGDHVLDALEDYLADSDDVAIAEQRLSNIRSGQSDTVPLEDIARRYGLAG